MLECSRASATPKAAPECTRRVTINNKIKTASPGRPLGWPLEPEFLRTHLAAGAAAGASAAGASAAGLASSALAPSAGFCSAAAAPSGAAASGVAPPPQATAITHTGTKANNLEIDMLRLLLPTHTGVGSERGPDAQLTRSGSPENQKMSANL